MSVDFADACSIMRGQGNALMSIGRGSGENKVDEAVKSALDNPLMEDTSIKGATNMLVYVAGGSDLTMTEFHEVTEKICASAAPDAQIITGLNLKEELEGQLRVTVIATGFDNQASLDSLELQETEEEKCGGEVISASEFEQMRERTIRGLTHRNDDYLDHDNLDTPTVLRYRNFNAQPYQGYGMGLARTGSD